MYKTIFSVFVLVNTALQLTGCAQNIDAERMTVAATVGPSITEQSPYYKNVAIKSVTGGTEANPLLTDSISDSGFKGALEESFKNAHLGSDNKDARYKLTAHIKNVDEPFAGLDFNIKMTVAYHLEDSKTGRPVFNQVWQSVGKATVGEAPVATIRLRLAKEDAARKNIAMLIQHFKQMVYTLDR